MAAFSDIQGSGPHAADGVEASTITIILRDADNVPVSGVVPIFDASGSMNVLRQSCTASDAMGISTCSEALRSTAVEDKLLSITSPISKVGGTVLFTPVQVYRSIGPGNETALASGTGDVLEVQGSLAVFASPLADRVGVGDALQYDSDGDGVLDSIAFLHRRFSATSFGVRDALGLAAPDTGGVTSNWSVFRAYTSLYAAERGAENPAIDAGLRDFDPWSDGADLTARERIWNLVCYADAPDTRRVSISGWTCDPVHYLRIFTPTDPTEVGVSQRHAGAWDETRYRMEVELSGDYASVISANSDCVRIEGLQIRATGGGTIETQGIVIPWGGAKTSIEIQGNIVRGQLVSGSGGGAGIIVADDKASFKVWNNIVSEWKMGSSGNGIFCRGSGQVYHNTVYGSRYGIFVYSGVTVSNNVSLGNSTSDYYSAPHASSSHNAGRGSVPGGSPIILSSSAVADYFFGVGDLRINRNASLAAELIDAGVDLTQDSALPVKTDIAGTIRPQGAGVDPGAYEAP